MANLQSSTITGVLTEKIGTASASGTTITVDMSTGKVFEVDLDNASGTIATFTITNPPASGKMGQFTLKITQGSPARQFNWGSMSGADPDWTGGAPTLSDTYNAVNIFRFTTYDQGTTWHGDSIGQNFPGIYSALGDRGVFAGGYNGSANVNTMEYINITTTSNVTDFGDFSTTTANHGAALTNGSRGVFGGRSSGALEYITISTPGNSTAFGNAQESRTYVGSASGGGRGLFAGGYDGNQPSGNYRTLIEYITIATTGNGTTFGNISWTGTSNSQTGGVSGLAGVASDGRAVFGGGYSVPDYFNQMEYVTISTLGNSSVFGTLTVSRHVHASCSDGSRGVFAGGQSAHYPSDVWSNTIDYITIATTGNGTDFGDLVIGGGRKDLAGTGNSTRGVFAGGWKGSNEDTIEYITIATTGNSADFGNLSEAKNGLVATSGN